MTHSCLSSPPGPDWLWDLTNPVHRRRRRRRRRIG
jgi:hypothetical protein